MRMDSQFGVEGRAARRGRGISMSEGVATHYFEAPGLAGFP